MKILNLLQLGVCSLVVFCAGCVSAANDSRVDVELKNLSIKKLTDVAVWFGDAKCTAGILSPGIFADYMYYPAPITPEARVEWKDASGQQHTKTVDLSNVYQPGQSGILQIAITETGVEAKLLPLRTLAK
jgi:hypothetical protein